MKFNKSLKSYEKAIELIPLATQTFSKGPQQYPLGVAPVFLSKGKGSHVWDLDGNEFIDYPMGLGAVILGHGYPAVNRAIEKQLKQSVVHSLPHILEYELSKMLVDLIPCAEMVRFGKNGSDATAGAVRAARALTNREKIACCGYHGWQDWFIGTTTRSQGVPLSVKNLTLTFNYNDIASLEKIFAENPQQIAAVILEPVGVVEPQSQFLEKVKDLTHRNGALLIFDEIVTGFRMDMGGAQKYYHVVPDLACFGKAMGNGMPISCVVGKKDIMKVFDDIFYSFTFGGECLSLAASIATIQEMKKKRALKKMWSLGKILKDGYNKLVADLGLQELSECIGFPVHSVILFKESAGVNSLHLRTLFQQEAIQRGILAIGVHNICYSHTESDIQKTLKAYQETLGIIKKAVSEGDLMKYIKGKIVQPVFRKP